MKDYQRLKKDENIRLSLNWNLNREIAKLNYRIHTDAIKDNLIPPELTPDQISYKYANEADLLNVALFGMTAKQWREKNSDKAGNIRDDATLNQLLVLANIYRIFKSFDKIYSEFTDAEKKRFLGSFVEHVEIYEEEQENGRFLKNIKFRFPIYYNGTETQEVDLSDSSWDYQRSLETIALLSRETSRPAKDYVKVGIDAEEYYAIKNASRD